MDTAKHIISKFAALAPSGESKGIRPLSKALGHQNSSTVQGWWERGTIPVAHWPAVLQSAKESGIELSPNEFFPLAEQSEAAQ